MSEENNPYSESRIMRLRPHEQIRLRPRMYFGGTDERALHLLVFEVLNDSVEEAFQRQCSHIWLTLHPNDVVNIRDDSQGLPIRQLKNGKRLLEHIMTETGTRRIRGGYVVTGGMMGVGLNAVNALAADCTVQVAREDFLWQQSYREGVPTTDVVQVRPLDEGESTGTSITFRPDFTILDRNTFNYDTLAARARELAYLLPGLSINLCDERGQSSRQEEFYFTDGLTDYVRDLNQTRRPLHAPLAGSAEWTIRPDARGEYTLRVDVALQYAETHETTLVGYANTVRTSGGLHMDFLPNVVASTLRTRAVSETQRPFTAQECALGLTAVISVRHQHPSFESMAETRLLNHDVVSVVFDAVRNAFWSFERGEAVDSIMRKCLDNRRELED